MRYFLAVIMALAVLTTPALGVILISIVPDSPTLYVGQQMEVHILAQGTDAGVASIGGSILASGDPALETVPASLTFAPEFLAWGDAAAQLGPALGTAGADGGWSRFGTMQTARPVSYDYGKVAPVEIASYTVRGMAEGQVVLTLQAETVKGYYPVEANQSATVGQVTDAVIEVVLPEPASMALLVLLAGGMICTRRR